MAAREAGRCQDRRPRTGCPLASFCLARCANCSRCNYVTLSLTAADCSWYQSCDLNALHTLPGLVFKSGGMPAHHRHRLMAGEQSDALAATSMRGWQLLEASSFFQQLAPTLRNGTCVPPFGTSSTSEADWYAECDLDSSGLLRRAEFASVEEGLADCAAACRVCARCKYVTMSNHKCSWHSDCNLTNLHHTPERGAPTAFQRSYEVRPEQVPVPRVRSCDELRLPETSSAVWVVDRPSGVAIVAAPKGGSTEASLMMFRALGLLHEARGYTRPYMCDGWDCKPGVHWVGDYRFNVFGANDSHKVGPLDKACDRFCTSGSGVRCLQIVRWPLYRAISSYLYIIPGAEGWAVSSKWERFGSSNMSFRAFVDALEHAHAYTPGRGTAIVPPGQWSRRHSAPQFGLDHVYPQAEACDRSWPPHVKTYLPLERLDVALAHLRRDPAETNLTLHLRPSEGAEAAGGTRYVHKTNTSGGNMSGTRWDSGSGDDVASWTGSRVQWTLGRTRSIPQAAFLTDEALVRRLHCLFAADFALYRRMCAQLRKRGCEGECRPDECSSPLLLRGQHEGARRS